jgi:AraC-like DNA-binding protein
MPTILDMQMLTFAPTEPLAPFIRTFTILEAQEETTRVLIPDTAIALGFRFSGSARMLDGEGSAVLPNAVFTGLRNTTRQIRTSASGGMLLAMFHEGGAAQFFGEPLHEFFGTFVGLDALLSRSEIERIESRIAGAADHADRVAILEQFLLARRAARHPDPIVTAAVRAIRAHHGSVRIAAIAAALRIGQDRLEKRFRRAVGASPKQLASIIRVRHVISLHRAGTSLTRLSVEAGYFDQSHFIREFRSVTGKAPQRFFRAGNHC